MFNNIFFLEVVRPLDSLQLFKRAELNMGGYKESEYLPKERLVFRVDAHLHGTPSNTRSSLANRNFANDQLVTCPTESAGSSETNFQPFGHSLY